MGAIPFRIQNNGCYLLAFVCETSLGELPYIAYLGIVWPSKVSTLQNVALNCLEKLCVGPPRHAHAACHTMWQLVLPSSPLPLPPALTTLTQHLIPIFHTASRLSKLLQM